jgi:nucleotide-binding universal stress UspA family protein
MLIGTKCPHGNQADPVQFAALDQPFFWAVHKEKTMLSDRLTSGFTSNGFVAMPQLQPRSTASSPKPRYKHIVVPVTLASDDRDAFFLAAELAAGHHASLTVLIVQPAAADLPSMHWLHAIDCLHYALDGSSTGKPGDGSRDPSSPSPAKISDSLEREVSQYISDGLAISIDIEIGEFAETVARYAEEASADLVVLGSGQPRWWLPVLPTHIRRAMRLMRQRVILIRPAADTSK